MQESNMRELAGYSVLENRTYSFGFQSVECASPDERDIQVTWRWKEMEKLRMNATF